MGKLNIIRESGKVVIKDDFTTYLSFDDNSELEQKIKNLPDFDIFEKGELLKMLKECE